MNIYSLKKKASPFGSVLPPEYAPVIKNPELEQKLTELIRNGSQILAKAAIMDYVNQNKTYHAKRWINEAIKYIIRVKPEANKPELPA